MTAMRMVWLSLVLAAVALAQEPPAKDPCDAHVDRLLELDATFAVFRGLSISGEPKLLKQSLRAAVKQHQDLSAAYTRIAAAKCGLVSVDAKVMLGRLDDLLAKKIAGIAPPPGLLPEQRDLFASELDARAAPLRERAKTTWASAVSDAATFQFDSELIRLARKRMQDEQHEQEAPVQQPREGR